MPAKIEMTDLERQGVNAVSSFMGHFESGSDERRLGMAARAVLDLSDDGLAAADRHLRMCQGALESDELSALMPDGEQRPYQVRRAEAIMMAFVLVRGEINPCAQWSYTAE